MTIHVFYLHKFSFSSIGGPTLRIWLAFSWTSFVRTSGLNSIKRSAALGKLQNFQLNSKKFLNFLKTFDCLHCYHILKQTLSIIVFSIETFFIVWIVFLCILLKCLHIFVRFYNYTLHWDSAQDKSGQKSKKTNH